MASIQQTAPAVMNRITQAGQTPSSNAGNADEMFTSLTKDVGVLYEVYCIECKLIGCNLKQTDFIAATLQQDRMGGKFVPG